MTRTTALAAILALAAFPAAGQSQWDASVPPETKVAPSAPEAGVPEGGHEVSYRGTITGLPGLAMGGPAITGTLASGPLAPDVPPTAPPLSHLDFGAYEPYDPVTARQVLKDIASSRNVSPKASDGKNDVSLAVSGTAGATSIDSTYATSSGPVAVKAKAGVVVPGIAQGDASNFIQSTTLGVAMKYKF